MPGTAPAARPEREPGREVITAHVTWNIGEDEALAAEWMALDALGRCEPSTTLDWVRALLAAQLRETDTVFAVTMRAAGRLVAVLPMVIRRERVLGALDVAVMQPLSALYSTHADVARSDDRHDLVAAFFAAIAGLPCRWDVMRMRRLLDCNPIRTQMTSFLARSGFAYQVRREPPSYWVDLNPTYEQFLAARSAKFRNYLRRRTRQLDAMGRVRVLWAGRDLDVGTAYEQFLGIELRSWKHASGTAVSAAPRQQVFYRRFFEGAARSGRLRLSLMYLDDLPVAYDLGVLSGAVYSYLKTSFDESLRGASPATVLRARTIEGLIAEGVHAVGFVGEPHPWKEQWANVLRRNSSVLVFNRTVRGRLLGLRERLRRTPAAGERA